MYEVGGDGLGWKTWENMGGSYEEKSAAGEEHYQGQGPEIVAE